MKRITIVVADELVDMAKLMEAVGIVHELHVETIPDVPVAQPALAPVAKHALPAIDKGTIAGIIMSHYQHGVVFDRQTAADWVASIGYAPQSAGSSMSRLVRDGYVEKAGPGKWRFIAPAS